MSIKRSVRVFCFFLLTWLLLPSALADIEVHFLDVGQGDSAVIICDGETMMIDGGQPDRSQFIFSYLKNTLGLDRIDYVIATHPDSDHIGGLSAALNACTAGVVYSPTTDNGTKTFQSLLKYTQNQGLDLIVPQAGDCFYLGKAKVDIIAPVSEYEDENNGSIVLRITYGSISFLFTGDIETAAESDIIRTYGSLQSTVLKISHHGSESSTSNRFLDAVQPQYAVISVGENSYGHPADDTLKRIFSHGSVVYRTDENGTIICHSDGDTVFFSTEKAAVRSMPVLENEPDTPARYIGNRNSKKFHYADCPSVGDMKEKNKVEFSDREEAIDAGYVPCQRCNP